MKKLSILLMVMVVLVSSLPTLGLAASPWTTETTTSGKMMGKLGYGLKNTLLGWTEIVRQPFNGAKDEHIIGFGKGLGTGLYDGVMYTLGGVLHVVTFPVTSLDIPIHEGGVSFEERV